MGKPSIMERCVSLAVLLSLLTVGFTEGVSGPNLALGKPTLQSSISSGGDSDRAVDGNTNGNYKGNSCTHTSNDNSPWWSVDLGGITRVTDVDLFNRRDRTWARLSDVDVIVSNSPRPSDEEGTVCGHFDGSIHGNATIHCDGVSDGRYVIVMIHNATGPLSLCEVMVYGSEESPNLALGKPTNQSSISSGGDSDRAVDGNTNGIYKPGQSCTHTSNENSPWWSVDLEAITGVTDVVLYNRVDCCGNRLRDFDVIVSNSPRPSSEEGTVCGHFDGSASANVTIHCDPPSEGRYVIVTIPGTQEVLTLCEVMVYYRVDQSATSSSFKQSGANADHCFGLAYLGLNSSLSEVRLHCVYTFN